MILTVIIGNTNSRLAFFEGQRLVRSRVVPTSRLEPVLANLRLSSKITGAAVASVVPKKTLAVYRALSRQVRTMLFNSRTGVPIRVHYNRRLLGADRLCVAAGAFSCYHQDLIVIDFGTAITFNAVKMPGVFLGGPILPGAQLMLNGLAAGTGRLPRVDFYPRSRVLSWQTRPAMQSGVFFLLVGGIKLILSRITSEAGLQSPLVIGTGGGIRHFVRHFREIISIVDQNLASRGLAEIYYYNRRQNE
ncbi:MAG: type III pantothenate kinase [candidate division WOR-3 bacterium]